MRKIIFILALMFFGVGVWFLLKKSARTSLAPTQDENQVSSQPAKTNLVIAPSNSHAPKPTNTVETIAATNMVLDAITATNLEQWKSAVKGLRQLGGFKLTQEWAMETPGRKTGIPIILNLGGKTVQYSAVLISVSAENGSGDVREIQMQTPNMTIDETRELGLKLCNMLQVDPKGFLAWCDKVGNHWMDEPLFGDGDGHHYSFHLLQTFNNEKPWSINFMITPNP